MPSSPPDLAEAPPDIASGRKETPDLVVGCGGGGVPSDLLVGHWGGELRRISSSAVAEERAAGSRR
jgi:hypothetical protein